MNSVSPDEKDSSQQIAEADQGGISLPDRDFYLDDVAAFCRDPRCLRGAHQEDVRSGRRLARGVRQRGSVGDGNRNRDGQSLHGARGPARSREGVSHLHRGRLPEADAGVRLEDLLQHRSASDPSTPSMWSRPISSRGSTRSSPSEPLDAWKSYLRWQVLHGEASNLSERLLQRRFPFLRADPGRAKDAAAALEAVHPRHRRGAGRGRRPGLGQAELSARGQSQHGQAGGRSGKSSG